MHSENVFVISNGGQLHSSLQYRVMHLRPKKFKQFTVNYFAVMTCFVDGRAP